MTRRGTTNSTGNLGGGVLILVKNGLSYTSLSIQSLSSLDPSSDYLAIAVKVKGASPIHLFNVYVPPIRSSSSDSRPKSFSKSFLLPSSRTTYIFGDVNSHHSSWDSHSPEDQSGKDLFDWLLSSDHLPLNNPELWCNFVFFCFCFVNNFVWPNSPKSCPPFIYFWCHFRRWSAFVFRKMLYENFEIQYDIQLLMDYMK